jgi:hypothetical protein
MLSNKKAMQQNLLQLPTLPFAPSSTCTYLVAKRQSG